MNIKMIHISNFKSFDDETIYFDRLNVLVGANAAGKSNIISLFRFFTNIINNGIDDAISMLGGMEYILNSNIGKSRPLCMKIIILLADENRLRPLNLEAEEFACLDNLEYEFEITPHKKGNGYKISKDILTLTFSLYDRTLKEIKSDKKHIIVYQKNKRGKVSCKFETIGTKTLSDDEKHRLSYDFFLPYINDERGTNQELFIHDANIILPSFFQGDEFIKIFDFDPYLMKQASHMESKTHLEENGSNVANILQKILINKTSRQRLIGLMKEFLPFFEGIEVENNFDQSVTYKIKEVYSEKKFYANFLSDGTVNVLALIIALYFTKETRVIVLEEPERNLHPQLMRKLIEFAKDAAEKKQIIITTHTPEIVKYTDISSLILAHRSKDGFTHIERPAESEKVKIFLNNDIGVDELFAQNMLGV